MQHEIPTNLSICVFQHWGLGDLLMTTPAIAELRRVYPNARIILVVRGKAQAALLKGSALVDEILELPSNGNVVGIIKLFWRLRKRRVKVGYIATRITPAVAVLLRLFAGVHTVIGDGSRFGWLYTYKNTIDPRVHRVDRMLKTLSLWTGQGVTEPSFPVPIAEKARERAEEMMETNGLLSNQFIVLHPGSSKGVGTGKRIPSALVKGIIAGVSALKSPLRMVILFGPDDEDLLPEYSPPTPGVTLISAIPLDETKTILQRASGFVGSDSALGHLASAYGVPTITCVGPTNPDETRPYGSKSVIVRSDEELSCRPCWFTPLYGNCPYDRRCMRNISSDKIITTIRKWMQNEVVYGDLDAKVRAVGDDVGV